MTENVDIRRLRTAAEVSEALKGRITAEALSDLANTGYAPHYRVGELSEPLFKFAEIKQWVTKHLLVRSHASRLPHIVQVVSGGSPVKNLGSVPPSIRLIPGLMDITAASRLSSGIYFMCLGDRVVYVGRSTSVGSRIGQHVIEARKVFDTILHLPWPADSLAQIEAELIRALKPEYNTVGLVGDASRSADKLLLMGITVREAA